MNACILAARRGRILFFPPLIAIVFSLVGWADETVKMSPYEVSANSVGFEGWIKLRTPHYVLYTDAKMDEATKVLRELEMVHLATQYFFRRRARATSPIVVVLPTSRSDWRKIESKGGVQWKVAVSTPATHVGKLIVVQYDWQNSGIQIVHAAQSDYLLSAINLRGPFWFERGVGLFLETAEFDENMVILGRQSRRTASLEHAGWLRWNRFFQVDPKSPEFIREDEIHRYNGQCAVFLQYLLAHPEPAWLERLIHWYALMDAGREPTDAEFKEVFGHDFKSWQSTMNAYMRSGSYHVTKFRIPDAAVQLVPEKLDLPVREMRELFVLSQIMNQQVKASESALDALLAKGLKTESLQELLIEACFNQKRFETARELVRKRIAEGSSNPEVYGMGALWLFVAKIPKPDLHTRLDEEQAEEIKRWTGKALAIDPLNQDALNLLAWAEAMGPVADAATLGIIETIYHRLYGHVSTSDVLTALAVARWRTGDKAGAQSVCDALLGSPFTGKDDRKMIERLVQELSTASQ